jgi:uncharacterized protein (TIGR03437 family)
VRPTVAALFIASAVPFSVNAQPSDYPYVVQAFAGTFPLGDGGPAVSALLYRPLAAVKDGLGNLFVLDDNYGIRKVAPDGTITTFTGATGSDLKIGTDGNLWLSEWWNIFRIEQGALTIVAGTNRPGYNGDGPAATTQLQSATALSPDSNGNVYFIDYLRVRELTADGQVKTIAGWVPPLSTADNISALQALIYPAGLAVDRSGNVYISDSIYNKIRKVDPSGVITTIAGNGTSGNPVNGPALLSPLNQPGGLWIDGQNNIYAAVTGANAVVRISPDGMLTRQAGSGAQFGDSGDGLALRATVPAPNNVSADAAGNLYIVDATARVRQVSPDGNLRTIVGRLHYGGDGGAAASAILNGPQAVTVDFQGNILIADTENYRIRKVARDGTITTIAGTGVAGAPVGIMPGPAAPIGRILSLAADSQGTLYAASLKQIFKIAPDGTMSVFAGTGGGGSIGDGGPALQATFGDIWGLACDPAGNLYVADVGQNRVRKIDHATGIITAFAGTGAIGHSGDGGPAVAARLSMGPGGIAADQKGNIYISDSNNIRMVNASGVISNLVGNGQFGEVFGPVSAASTPFSSARSMTVDATGTLYVAVTPSGDIYGVRNGIVYPVAGAGGYAIYTEDSFPFLGVFADGIGVDSAGDLYAADHLNNAIRKVVLNSPTGLAIVAGNGQTAAAGQSLPENLRVEVTGRAGAGVPGITINFTVTSGSATLAVAAVQTDAFGDASVGVTFGPTAGAVVITASAPGTGLSPVQFTETASVPKPICSVPQPVVASVNSVGDFGGSLIFAPGSWLEIKGANLAQTTRSWRQDDFDGASAPTSLDGVVVTINGRKAFVSYISPNQINVQAPEETISGSMPLVVTTAGCSSTPVAAQETAIAPGLLAPASFHSVGKQYLAAVLPDGSFVGPPGLIPGALFRPAAPGESIVVYGIGFGSTTPAVPPGMVTGFVNSIANLTVSFGSTPASLKYAGLAPGVVGLYQFNIVVPDVADGDYPISFQEGTTRTAQTVYLTVHR